VFEKDSKQVLLAPKCCLLQTGELPHNDEQDETDESQFNFDHHCEPPFRAGVDALAHLDSRERATLVAVVLPDLGWAHGPASVLPHLPFGPRGSTVSGKYIATG
jgi:hypothetical protein